MIFRRALDALASVIFPAPCRMCGEALANASRIPICEACLGSFEPISEPMCQICGRPFTYRDRCADGARRSAGCAARDFSRFDRARSYANVQRRARKAIVLLKYEEVTPLGDGLRSGWRKWWRGRGEAFRADVVVPVPLHPDRQRERGYNQAELIARPLARRLGI